MKVLELYSGIGGMHMALKSSGVDFEVIAAIDINPVANSVYKHNFPGVAHLNRNIQGLSAEFINKSGVDTILMSPPCQPFTRNGLQNDISDARTDSFKHVLDILEKCVNIERILIENVKGFESSLMRNLLVETLSKCGFVFQEFILTPTEFGVPNTRHRYYCLAKKKPREFSFERGDLMLSYPVVQKLSPVVIEDILETNRDFREYYLSDKILIKYGRIIDICFKDSYNSCCFTKAYARYIHGTGSVFTSESRPYVEVTYEKIAKENDNAEALKLYKSLNLRFFTPKEVCRLMSFPEEFSFPQNITERQRYYVLGNSVNVKVVSELIKILL